ncbi:MAG TPA: PilZ domain-containing protein [Stellaceae bacterium]
MTLSAADLQAMRDQWKEFRRFRRKSVILASTLETAHGGVQCVALDLSLGGARIRVQEKLELQEEVTLVLAKFGRFPGLVAWRNAWEVGLQFNDTPEEVARRFGNDIPFE